MKKLDVKEIRDFVSRPWGAFERANVQHWAEQTPKLKLRLADDLRIRAARFNSGWPNAEDRTRDFDAHRRLVRLLQEASRGLA